MAINATNVTNLMVISQFYLLGILYCRNIITMVAQAEIARKTSVQPQRQ
jgi:hypothetical protein